MNAEAVPKKRRSDCVRTCLIPLGVFFILACLVLYFPFKHGVEEAVASSGVQTSHALELALSQYAFEHPDEFAKAKSSTEVFQKMLDEKYVDDARTFYYPLPGKIRTTPDVKILLPENVGFDLTFPFNNQTPKGMPIVFLSGYAVTYMPGAKAVPIKRKPTWFSWWQGQLPPYMLVTTKGEKAIRLRADADGSIPNFIPADFDPKGQTYRQLTPDGVLEP